MAAQAPVSQTEARLLENGIGWHELLVFQSTSEGEEAVKIADEESCCNTSHTTCGNMKISDEELPSGAEVPGDGLRDLPELGLGKAVEKEVGDYSIEGARNASGGADVYVKELHLSLMWHVALLRAVQHFPGRVHANDTNFWMAAEQGAKKGAVSFSNAENSLTSTQVL